MKGMKGDDGQHPGDWAQGEGKRVAHRWDGGLTMKGMKGDGTWTYA